MPLPQQEIHSVFRSFGLFLDHLLLSIGDLTELFEDCSLSYYEDARLPNYDVYGSHKQQWVYDSSIAPQPIVTVDGQVTNDAIVDYLNGRVLLPKDPYGAEREVKATFTAKSLNLYMRNESESVVFEHAIRSTQERQLSDNLRPVEVNQYTAPLISLAMAPFNPQPFAFGGIKEFKYMFKAAILTDSRYITQGVCSLLAERCYETCFPNIVDPEAIPLTSLGDLKNTYEYPAAATTHHEGPKPYFGDIFATPVQRVSENNRQLFAAIVDFDITHTVFPKTTTPPSTTT